MNYVVQDTSLTAVADAIRKQTKLEEQLSFPNGFVSEIGKIDAESSYNNGYQQGYTEGETKGEEQGYDRGYGEGQKAEYDKFWDNYQQNGERVNYNSFFATDGWTEQNFKPKYKIVPTTAQIMFNSGVPHIAGDLTDMCELDLSKCTDVFRCFGNNNFTHIGVVDLSSTTSAKQVFLGNRILHTIDKLISHENITTFENIFMYDVGLENLTIEGVIPVSLNVSSSPNLSNASVQSIIDHLKDLTGETAQTLTLHANVKANLTEEQKAQITSKNWTLA